MGSKWFQANIYQDEFTKKLIVKLKTNQFELGDFARQFRGQEVVVDVEVDVVNEDCEKKNSTDDLWGHLPNRLTSDVDFRSDSHQKSSAHGQEVRSCHRQKSDGRSEAAGGDQDGGAHAHAVDVVTVDKEKFELKKKCQVKKRFWTRQWYSHDR